MAVRLPGAGHGGVVDGGAAAVPVYRDAVLLVGVHHVAVQRGRADVCRRAGRGETDLNTDAALAAVGLRVAADVFDRAVGHDQVGPAENGHPVERVVTHVRRPAALDGEPAYGHLHRVGGGAVRTADVHHHLVGVGAAVRVTGGKRIGRAGGPNHRHLSIGLEDDALGDGELLVVGARAHFDGVAGAGRGQRAGDGGVPGVGTARAGRGAECHGVGDPPGRARVGDGRRSVPPHVAHGAAGAEPEGRDMMHAHRRSRGRRRGRGGHGHQADSRSGRHAAGNYY